VGVGYLHRGCGLSGERQVEPENAMKKKGSNYMTAGDVATQVKNSAR